MRLESVWKKNQDKYLKVKLISEKIKNMKLL